ncbi:MAG: AMP-binding protein, partial [Desulfobacterales bacterium]|nr:AMP-binding protein [Desulfobacterales bacterium]
DLSVYDVFGLLGEGGSILLIPEAERRDADFWLEMSLKHGVTLWNSVPVLAEMLLTTAESKQVQIPSLKTVLLSGDWISLDLPARLGNTAPESRLIAMGGATEAAIWSNACQVELPLPSHWTSIPYGRPLTGQAYRVMDTKGRDCPDMVAGELWIGGKGLAVGYKHDPELTAQSFIQHDGATWYRTGDLGRYWSDGQIEFLGRKDFQVKIRGHRIEPGEIETILCRHPGVANAMVNAVGDPKGSRRLAGYLVAAPKADKTLMDTETIDPDTARKMDDSMVRAGEVRSTQVPTPDEFTDFTHLWQGMETTAVKCMCNTLIQLGLFTQSGESHTLDSLMEKGRIIPVFRKLMGQWLAVLTEDRYLDLNQEKHFTCIAPLPQAPESALWEPIKQRIKHQPQASILLDFFINCSRNHGAMLRGETQALELFFSDGSWEIPEVLYQHNPFAAYYNGIVRDVVKATSNSPDTPIRIIEVGAGTGGTAAAVLPVLPPDSTEYIYTDITPFFHDRAREKFKDYSFIRYATLDINHPPMAQGHPPHTADLVLAANVLHDASHVEKTLTHLATLLKPGGRLILLEGTRNIRLQMISVGFIEGLSHYQDQRLETNLPLLSRTQWETCLKNTGFAPIAALPGDAAQALGQAFFEQQVFIARAPLTVNRFVPDRLKDYLGEHLPEYMVPDTLTLLKEWPLNANGKIDRKALPIPGDWAREEKRQQTDSPQGPLEEAIAEIWQSVLDIDSIGRNDDFFRLGGDSLLATRLVADIRKKLNVNLNLGTLFKTPTVTGLAHRLRESTSPEEKPTSQPWPALRPNPTEQHSPFPLTGIQQAYWLGRSGAYALGSVSAHCYFEIQAENLDLDRTALAWQRLIQHHDMMRAVVLPDGQSQKVLEQVPAYEIRTKDYRYNSEPDIQQGLGAIRTRMSHQVIQTAKWPLFDIRATLLPQGMTRLHISLDNLMFDGWSMIHLFNEWARLYEDPDAPLVPQTISFRDYVLAMDMVKASPAYERDRQYWMAQLPHLPPAPALPLANDPQRIDHQTFDRRSHALSPATWQKLKDRAAREGITASAMLITAFSMVLGRWSRTPQFTLNLTLFNRLPLHPDVNKIVGDFTTLNLLSVDLGQRASFKEKARAIQARLWEDLDHGTFSGLDVLREYARMNDKVGETVMPVVFTSALGVEHANGKGKPINWNMDAMGELIHGISQTPQVWLDHQVMEKNDGLTLV